MTALEYFRLFAGEFADTPDGEVSIWIGISESLANVSGLNPEAQAQALAVYAAHLYSLTKSQAEGANSAQGVVLRDKEGDLERTYASLKDSNTWLGSTSYGQLFLEFTKGISGAAILTRIE